MKEHVQDRSLTFVISVESVLAVGQVAGIIYKGTQEKNPIRASNVARDLLVQMDLSYIHEHIREKSRSMLGQVFQRSICLQTASTNTHWSETLYM